MKYKKYYMYIIQVAALFKKIDRDGNGKIDWTEFKQMYSQN